MNDQRTISILPLLSGVKNVRVGNFAIADSREAAQLFLREPAIDTLALRYLRPSNTARLERIFQRKCKLPGVPYLSAAEREQQLHSGFADVRKRDLKFACRHLTRMDVELAFLLKQNVFGGFLQHADHKTVNVYAQRMHTDAIDSTTNERGLYWRLLTVLCGQATLDFPDPWLDRERFKLYRRAISQERSGEAEWCARQLRADAHYRELRLTPSLELPVWTPVLRRVSVRSSLEGAVHAGPLFLRPLTAKRVLHFGYAAPDLATLKSRFGLH